ncbi:TetR/AcrR family transcriptional regulator [Glycomyces scopariae]
MSNRDKLLSAARECLLTIGYANTTVRELVRASGANQASINYHFGSKEQLLTLTLRELNREWGEVLFAAIGDQEGTVTGAEREALWARIIESVQANRALWFVNFESVAVARTDEEIRAMIAEGLRMSRRSLARAFTGLDPDRDDPARVRAAGSHYYALLVGVAAQWIADPESAPSAAEVAAADGAPA